MFEMYETNMFEYFEKIGEVFIDNLTRETKGLLVVKTHSDATIKDLKDFLYDKGFKIIESKQDGWTYLVNLIEQKVYMVNDIYNVFNLIFMKDVGFFIEYYPNRWEEFERIYKKDLEV